MSEVSISKRTRETCSILIGAVLASVAHVGIMSLRDSPLLEANHSSHIRITISQLSVFSFALSRRSRIHLNCLAAYRGRLSSRQRRGRFGARQS